MVNPLVFRRRRVATRLSCLLLFLCALGWASAAPIPVQSFQQVADGVVFSMQPGTMKLRVCGDGIIRVAYGPGTSLPATQEFAAMNPIGRIPGSTFMDVFNPAVRTLRWNAMNSAFFGIGTDAWWQDATEPEDENAMSNNGATSKFARLRVLVNP